MSNTSRTLRRWRIHRGPSRIARRRQPLFFDNYWVLTHSPVLLLSFACHLKVELFLSRVGGINCPERVLRLDHQHPRCRIRFLIGGMAFILLLHANRNPPVVILAMHQPNHRSVYFEEGRKQEAALLPAPGTKLSKWLKAKEKYSGAKHIR